MYMVSVMYMVVVQYSSIKEPKAGKIMNASVEYPIQQRHILTEVFSDQMFETSRQ